MHYRDRLCFASNGTHRREWRRKSSPNLDRRFVGVARWLARRNHSRRTFGHRRCPCHRGKAQVVIHDTVVYNGLILALRRASGSFRLTTHPSSVVETSCTSLLCAQTTARAPVSSGALSNSS